MHKDALPTTQHDVKAKFNRLLANLDSIVEIEEAYKKLKKVTKQAWISTRIRKMMHLRDKLLKKSEKSKYNN